MSDYEKIEYKPTYLRGYFPVRAILKTKYKEEITPNEYFDKYVSKVDKKLATFERILNLDDKRIYLYRVFDGYKYLVAILPVNKENK